jgi:hypothetical protein
MFVPIITYSILQGQEVFWIHREIRWLGYIVSSRLVGKPFKTLNTVKKVMEKMKNEDYFFVKTPGEEANNGCLVPAVVIVLGIIGYILF